MPDWLPVLMPGLPPEGSMVPPVECVHCGVLFSADWSACPSCGWLRQRPAVPGSQADLIADLLAHPRLERPTHRNNHRVGMAISAIAAILVVVAGVVIAVTSSGGSYANSTAHGVTVADGTSFVYTSKAGHFSARFPDRPDERSIKRSDFGVDVTIYLATSSLTHIQVASERLSEDVPNVRDDTVLRAALTQIVDALGTTFSSQEETTFQGQPALEAAYESGGTPTTVLISAYSEHEVYLIVAPSGPAYDGVKSSFRAI